MYFHQCRNPKLYEVYFKNKIQARSLLDINLYQKKYVIIYWKQKITLTRNA